MNTPDQVGEGTRSAAPGVGLVASMVFIDMLAFAVILPVLPFYAMGLGASGLWLGVLLSSYSGAKLLGAATAGRLSDRYGRRPVLIACLAGSGVSFVLTGLSGSLILLASARAVAGLFGGTVATAQAYAADVSAPEQRARAMGIIGASIGAGFIFGPAIGAAISGLGFRYVCWIAAGVAFANAGYAALRLRETPHRDSGATTRLRDVVGRPAVLRILAALGLTVFAFVSMETTLAFVARDRYGLHESGFGMILAYVGVIMILMQGVAVGRLTPRVGERALALFGALLLGASMVVLPFTSNLTSTLLVLGVLAVGQGLASPTLAALLSRRAAEAGQGGLLGLGQSAASFSRASAPVIAGWLYDQALVLPFVAAGVLGLVASVALQGLRRDKRGPA